MSDWLNESTLTREVKRAVAALRKCGVGLPDGRPTERVRLVEGRYVLRWVTGNSATMVRVETFWGGVEWSAEVEHYIGCVGTGGPLPLHCETGPARIVVNSVSSAMHCVWVLWGVTALPTHVARLRTYTEDGQVVMEDFVRSGNVSLDNWDDAFAALDAVLPPSARVRADEPG